ncbi:hypothetical protein BHS09_26575 [Myxococcus xanthus]|uniref:Pentapeptide repeat-containing protein n=1 Tax=Myxococcus xanthus TaxID=34 RepID=A0AAE6G3H7_MYXXA|nr:pentapeptide repeat-containing protein [Myxococcus xanthus]QDE70249.1 hypothetical protein BHS09_26575 [Myxococcus xanthus]QDE77528.1 hypothetical protein BHS08_26595 [Myxococcus xanthus]
MADKAKEDIRLAERLSREEYFESETFSGEDLQGANLGDKEFYRCVFENCQFHESLWKGVAMEACAFRGCNVTRAQVANAKFRDVRFENSKLMGIDWSDVSSNPDLHFEDCGLSYCSFVGLNLRKLKFLRCVVREANFFDSDLTDSEFDGSDFGGSNFHGCNLNRADFSGASGVFLDPARNTLKDTRVPLESAIDLARTLGMLVVGYHDDVKKRVGRKDRGARQ